MKHGTAKILIGFVGLFFVLPVCTWAATYRVSTATGVVDGTRFCGGTACTSADKIIIQGGSRGNLLFQNFNGKGSYIVITNENKNPDSRVIINNNSSLGAGILSLTNCKYVDLRGNGDPDITYGIKVINDGTPVVAGTVRVSGKSDHIKIGYIECAFDGNTTNSGNGIFVQDKSLTNAWIWSNFEIHHNYIHDARYAGMYLGQNEALGYDDPYVDSFSVHDNLMINNGVYGLELKSIHDSTDNYVYNNTIKKTGIVSRPDLSDTFRKGMAIYELYNNSKVYIYNNWVEKTVGSGIVIFKNYGPTATMYVHDNIVVGCGTGNDPRYGNGITCLIGSRNNQIYNNIIIQPKRYGIFTTQNNKSTPNNLMMRNKIGGAGIGEWGHYYNTGNLEEATGANANIYHADVADFGFQAWSDDGDYSNDIFIVGGPKKLRIVK